MASETWQDADTSGTEAGGRRPEGARSLPSSSLPPPASSLPPPASHLRVYAGEHGGDGSAEPGSADYLPAMRLSEFAARFLPRWHATEAHQEDTRQGYGKTLSRWRCFTDDPPLEAIDAGRGPREVEYGREVVDAFFAGMRAERNGGLSVWTLHRAGRELRTLLALAGPPTAHQPTAARLIGCGPFVRLPKLPKMVPEGPELWELRQIIEAATDIRWHRGRIEGITATVFWRCLIAFVFNTAARRGETLAARFADVTTKRPGAIGTAARQGLLFDVAPVGEERWIKFRAGTRKGGGEHQVPLNGAAWEAIRAMQRPGGAVIFAWPHGKRHFAKTWKQLVQEVAGLPWSKRLHFHRIRSTGVSEVCRINGAAGKLLAGHETDATTTRHYLQPLVMRDAVDRLPRLF